MNEDENQSNQPKAYSEESASVNPLSSDSSMSPIEPAPAAQETSVAPEPQTKSKKPIIAAVAITAVVIAAIVTVAIIVSRDSDTDTQKDPETAKVEVTWDEKVFLEKLKTVSDFTDGNSEAGKYIMENFGSDESAMRYDFSSDSKAQSYMREFVNNVDELSAMVAVSGNAELIEAWRKFQTPFDARKSAIITELSEEKDSGWLAALFTIIYGAEQVIARPLPSDTIRKNAVSLISSALVSYASNNNGNLPEESDVINLPIKSTAKGLAQYINSSDDIAKVADHIEIWMLGGDGVTMDASSPGARAIRVVVHAKCGGSKVIGTSGRAAAIYIELESGELFCEDM